VETLHAENEIHGFAVLAFLVLSKKN